MEDFKAERNLLWNTIHKLKRRKTLHAMREARQLLRNWMIEHPDDHYSQDAGESLAMLEDALEYIEAEKSVQPVTV